MPANTNVEYSYSQQIYLQSEIGMPGEITKIRFYMVGGVSLSNTRNWTIYLGHTTKTYFSSNGDWVPYSALTEVFSGTIAETPAAGWYEITLSGSFRYNNVDNLVVAVNENSSGQNTNTNYLRYWTPSVSNRGIRCSASGTNINPVNPPWATGRISSLSQIQLVFSLPSHMNNWEVVFEDNFDSGSTSIPPVDSVWKAKDGIRSDASVNYFDPDKPYMQNGKLVLSAENLGTSSVYSDACLPWLDDKTCRYAGSEVSTFKNFRYGYFEAKVKFPTNHNLGPSFWLSVKSEDNGCAYMPWPPEIDIFEYFYMDTNSNYPSYSLNRNHLMGTNQRPGCIEGKSNPKIGFSNPDNNSGSYREYILGVEWNESELKWYLNGVQQGNTVTSDVPHSFMRIVLTLGVIPVIGNTNPWRLDEMPMGLTFTDQDNMYVDWVRVWKPIGARHETDFKVWPPIYTSGTTNSIGNWALSDDDVHITGDYDGDGFDELLSISSDNSQYPKQHSYNSSTKLWTCDWTSTSLDHISNWYITPGVKYIPGDFCPALQGDEILCISPNNNYAKLINYIGTQSPTYWSYSLPGNNGNGSIGSWAMGSNDRYLKYDLNNDDKDELLCFSGNGTNFEVLSLNSCIPWGGTIWSWSTLYTNSASSQIVPNSGTTWNMSASDIYLVGDFNGNGIGDLLMINDYSDCIKLYEYNASNGSWNYVWGNNCSGSFNTSWNLNAGSRYYVANFDDDLNTELFCISPDNKYEKILDFTGSQWITAWGNDGSHQIYNRDILSTDQFLFGNYASTDKTQVLVIKNAWTECNQTHVFLHEIPDLSQTTKSENEIVLNADNTGIERRYVVYPNPSSGKVFIENEGIDKNVDVWVFNNIGEKIQNFSNIPIGTLSIDFSSQPAGMYFIIINADGKIQTEKIIKQ